jgi:hypothetical protein
MGFKPARQQSATVKSYARRDLLSLVDQQQAWCSKYMQMYPPAFSDSVYGTTSRASANARTQYDSMPAVAKQHINIIVKLRL